jgi:hypothetical protein
MGDGGSSLYDAHSKPDSMTLLETKPVPSLDKTGLM